MICSARFDEISLLAAAQALAASLSCGTVEAPDGKILLSNIFPSGASTVPQLRLAAKAWAAANKDISSKRAEQIISAFIREAQRHALPPSLYDEWCGGH